MLLLVGLVSLLLGIGALSVDRPATGALLIGFGAVVLVGFFLPKKPK